MRRRAIWALVVVGVIAAAAIIAVKVKGRERQASYRTETVQRGDIRVTVSATGTLDAVTTVQVGSQISGTIAKLYADFNDRVKAGQLLAQLDPTFLQAQVAQSQADLDKAQVQVRQALRDSARVVPLGAQGLASKADVDNAETALDAARAAAASAKAALDRAKTNLHYATINSPIDGVVISRNVDVGQTVAASLSAPTLFTIANDLTQMQLEASVDEADIGQIREGQAATFTVDAYPNRTFTGQIHQIRLSPTTVSNVVTYSVIIYVQNPDEKLLPGMTANVTIQVDEVRDALKVPAMALRFRPPDASGRPSGTAAAGSGRNGGGTGAGMGAGAQGGPGGPGMGGQQRRGGRMGGGEGQGGAGGGPGGGNRGGGPAGSGNSGTGGQAVVGGDFGSGRPSTAGNFGNGGPAGGVLTGGRTSDRGTLYLLAGPRTLKPLRVRTGLTDGSFTAVYSDSLSEGEQVVIGLDLGSGGSASSQGQVNPFAPRFGGGRR